MQGKKMTGRLASCFLAVLMALGSFVPQAQAQPGVSVSFQTFYDDLSPYGTWLNDPQYGYVWAPNAEAGFRPYYTNGYWVNTDYGNMWMSDYSWGWAPFHYGRWIYTNTYGWVWIPGNEWGPAWVTWRQGGGYYGWAPMGPGVTVSMSFGSGYYAPDPYWTFIPCGYIYSRSFRRYYSPRRTGTIIRNTTIINNTYVDSRTRNTYVTGPRRSEVEKATGRSVRTYSVGARTTAGKPTLNGRTVNVYRPAVAASGGRNVKAAPRSAKTISRSVASDRGTGVRTNGNSRLKNTNPGTAAPANKGVQQRTVQPRSVDKVREAPKAPATTPARPSSAPVRQAPARPAPQRSNPPVRRSMPSTPQRNVQRPSRPAPAVRQTPPAQRSAPARNAEPRENHSVERSPRR